MSGKGFSINPQKRLNPSAIEIGQQSEWNGREWVPKVPPEMPSRLEVVTVGPYSTGLPLIYDGVNPNVATVFVNTSGTDAITIALPATTTVPEGWRFIVQDVGGNAAVVNVTIISGGGTIHGTATISTNYGALEYQSNGTDWFLCGSVP